MSFYMTLPCSASKKVYPENRPDNYTTVLAREVVLEGEYEVGLSECVIPYPHRGLPFRQSLLWCEIGLHKEYQQFTLSQKNVYNVMESALETMTDLPRCSTGAPAFRFSMQQKQVVLTVTANCSVLFNPTNKDLAAIFGFSMGQCKAEKNRSLDFVAPNPFLMTQSMLQYVHIYCDVVEYNIVGDSMVPCLRTIPILPGDTRATVLRFESPHYVPVAQNRFSHVRVEFANDYGEDLRLSRGTSMIKLHFRQKKR